MNRTILAAFLVYFTIGEVHAQIPSKPEDIAPLLIGERFPETDIVGINSKGTLATQLNEKPSVVIFYRGGWCPYCNRHLAAVGSSQQEILDLGYQIIGISPDTPEQLHKTTDKENLPYALFSDSSGSLIKAMGIAFLAPERYSEMLSNYSGGKNESILPVPSLFVVDTDGTILFEYISPNYKERISPKLLLNVLKSLKKQS